MLWLFLIQVGRVGITGRMPDIWHPSLADNIPGFPVNLQIIQEGLFPLFDADDLEDCCHRAHAQVEQRTGLTKLLGRSRINDRQWGVFEIMVNDAQSHHHRQPEGYEPGLQPDPIPGQYQHIHR